MFVYNLSGDCRFPDYQHAHSAAQLFPGAAAVLLSNGWSRGSTAGAPDPPQPHRQTRQQTQVRQNQVCYVVRKRVKGLKLLLLLGIYHLFVFNLCSIISDISVLKLKVDKCSRQDNLFMKKVLFSFYKWILQLYPEINKNKLKEAQKNLKIVQEAEKR